MLRGPVGRAMASLLEGDSQHDEELVMRVEDLEARLAELSLEQQRVGGAGRSDGIQRNRGGSDHA